MSKNNVVLGSNLGITNYVLDVAKEELLNTIDATYRPTIDTNTKNIATNKTNIDTNAKNIATNKTNITNLTNSKQNKITITNVDPGEGSALADGEFIAVYV